MGKPTDDRETRFDALQAQFEALQAQFDAGEAAAKDPTNATAVEGGAAVTTLRSRWLHLRCPECKHTFRTGDDVEVATDGTVRHHSAQLPCAGDVTTAAGSSHEVDEFFAGVEQTWPSPPDLPIRQLREGDMHVAAPIAAFRRHSCAVCGHTLRVKDQVILCPCSPGAPMCAVAIHRDPVRGMHCWDAWSPDQYRKHCPATSRKLHG